MSETTKRYIEDVTSMYLGDEQFDWWISVEPLGLLSPSQFGNVAVPSYVQEITIRTTSR
jgi:hypothetical protein